MTYWTDERTEALRVMLTEGKSASQAAKALGRGITRNMVIGKAWREGFKFSRKPSQSGGISHRNRKSSTWSWDDVARASRGAA